VKSEADGTVKPPDLENGNYEMVFHANNFASHYVYGLTAFEHRRKRVPTHVCLSKPTQEKEYRFILRWGNIPVDLDLHCIGSAGCHVFFANPNHQNGVTKVNLDIDVRNGNGPETVTMLNLQSGNKYHLLVHNFSGEAPLCHSGTRLAIVYGNSTREIEMLCTEDRNAFWWHAASLDMTDGALKVINKLLQHPKAPPPTFEQLNKLAFG